MAPPPEYDKEPKAPDKTATNISTEDSKLLHNLVNDQHTNSDHKPSNTVTAVEVENSKHVETLDDGQLKALLDEAINYKNPKDREGKSKIFKELLEEVEQESDEQACEAAARALSGCRGGRRGARRGAALAHSNSLQDLVAALAAEPPRRHHVRAQPAPPAPSVSARAIHGGSLPSGVDTSSLSEEPARGAGYLATVRCVNPPPLAERRVSASDANTPAEMELLNRRSKPMFPMTYTARATLEIGSGAVCSGRAVTTTTASNQVRTPASATVPATAQVPATDPQSKLMNALCARSDTDDGGGKDYDVRNDTSLTEHDVYIESASIGDLTGKTNIPRGPTAPHSDEHKTKDARHQLPDTERKPMQIKHYIEKCPQTWVENVDNWYKSLPNYTEPLTTMYADHFRNNKENKSYELMEVRHNYENIQNSVEKSTKSKILSSIADISSENKEIKNPRSKLPVDDSDMYSLKHTNKQIENEAPNSHGISKHNKDIASKESDSTCKRNTIIQKMKKHGLVAPSLHEINPKNVRPMSIATVQNVLKTEESIETPGKDNEHSNIPVDINSNTVDLKIKSQELNNPISVADQVLIQNTPIKCTSDCCNTSKKREQLKELIDMFNKLSSYSNAEIELKDVRNDRLRKVKKDSFSKYVALQQKLMVEIESLQEEIQNHTPHADHNVTNETENIGGQTKLDILADSKDALNKSSDTQNKAIPETKQLSSISEESEEGVMQVFNADDQNNEVKSDSDLSAELSNNAYVLLTLPSSNNTESFVSESSSKTKNGKKKENLSLASSNTNKMEDVLNKNILKVLLFENLFKNNSNEKSGIPGVSSITNDEVDSAISFSCITTPEVVASCNTTSSTSQSAVAVDPKTFRSPPTSTPTHVRSKTSDSSPPPNRVDVTSAPSAPGRRRLARSAAGVLSACLVQPLQLGSCYRAVASITGDAAPARLPAAPGPGLGPALGPGLGPALGPGLGPALGPAPGPVPGPVPGPMHAQPRSVISSSFNGLPLSRPNYGSTGTSATDDYKKSLDENGNSVQGFSSPLSGSSQHKKPRRKKSSKNETVIDCQQIDGYQGDKDVNELLRFIESNADNGRGAKLPRVKHKDDADDKGGKKRSAERRKDKESKLKRASSLDELSRTNIRDLTDAEAPLRPDKKERRDHAPAKAERRSWGDDARDAYEPADAAGPAAAELTDFQTVTKKRKPRRRADEPERDPPRRARPPSPRARRESAPPSDRSNDSNDDLDSVHSLPDAPRAAPPAPPPQPPHASYAEIARTRHNIPDLIESCNFYAEGEAGPRREPAPAPGDADGYPALDPRAPPARRRDAKPPPPALRRDRKERPAPAPDAARAPDCPAPDVVADRRPPVILLDAAVRPRDMDGVTFGFDINEQLLGGPARRPRCDLVRDAVAGVAVRAGLAALRYVPPEPPQDTHHLHQIIDYVGAAWEDVVRCGGGKVRYFSE